MLSKYEKFTYQLSYCRPVWVLFIYLLSTKVAGIRQKCRCDHVQHGVVRLSRDNIATICTIFRFWICSKLFLALIDSTDKQISPTIGELKKKQNWTSQGTVTLWFMWLSVWSSCFNVTWLHFRHSNTGLQV